MLWVLRRCGTQKFVSRNDSETRHTSEVNAAKVFASETAAEAFAMENERPEQVCYLLGKMTTFQ